MEPKTDIRQYPYDRLAAGFLPLLDEHRRAAVLLSEPAPLSSLGEMSKALRIAFLLAYARLADRVPPRVKSVSGWLPIFPDLALATGLRAALPALDAEDPPPTDENLGLARLVLAETLSLLDTLSSYEGSVTGYEPPHALTGVPDTIAGEVSEALGSLSDLPAGGDIRLFGSRATGTERADSDIDVAIIYPDTVLAEQSVRQRGRVEFHLLRESDLSDLTNLLVQGMLSANIPIERQPTDTDGEDSHGVPRA